MYSLIDFAARVVQRLASAIPSPSRDRSVHDTIVQIAEEILATQSTKDLLILTIVVVLSLELLSTLVYHLPKFRATSIPVRGKHLDDFSWKDRVFITINKCMTGLFVYCYFGYLWSERKLNHQQRHRSDSELYHHDHKHEDESLAGNHRCCGGKGMWAVEDLSFANTILPIPLLFITYDFFYTLLHWSLHLKSIYAYVHKHHHHQKAPSRANTDAVNVHPVEFFLGEFNHILALHLVLKGMPLIGFHGMDISWVGATLFMGLGGVAAGLNHTRYDIVLSIPSGLLDKEGKRKRWTLFDSKHHDVHHRIPQSNYGQYTVMWDRIFGTFREYDENDRVNPAYQLDQMTRKTVKSVKEE